MTKNLVFQTIQYFPYQIIKDFPIQQYMLKLNTKNICAFVTRQLAMFSQSQATTKGYRMPVRQVEKKFKPKKPVQFYQGRALIYLNKQGIKYIYENKRPSDTNITNRSSYCPHDIHWLSDQEQSMQFLFFNHQGYLTFPASLPIMGFIEIFLFMRFITHKKDNKYQIERIYLTQGGEMVEVWLGNKIRRKLKNTQDDILFQIEDLKTPPVGDNELPLKGTLFPQKFNDMKWPLPWQYGWYKYDSNRENYIIPKKYQYANWELLIPAMKGIQIDTSDCPKTPVPVDQLRKMPTLEEAIKQAEEKNNYDVQWEKKNGPVQYTVEEDV